MSGLLDVINGERARIGLQPAELNNDIPPTVQFRRATTEGTPARMYVVRLALDADPPDSVDVCAARSARELGRTVYEAIRGRQYTELARFSFATHSSLSEIEFFKDGSFEYFELTPRDQRAVMAGYETEARRVLEVNDRSRR